MILQIHTEKQLISIIEVMQSRLTVLDNTNKMLIKNLKDLQLEVDKKTNTVIKETVIKEIEKPSIKEVQTIKLDKSVLPTLKKLSDRLKALEDKKPETILPTLKKLSDRVKEIEEIKNSIKTIKPVIKNITEGVKENDVLSIIDKHVTMLYINKLYKKGAK